MAGIEAHDAAVRGIREEVGHAGSGANERVGRRAGGHADIATDSDTPDRG
jgi:hypothetical protein